MMITNFDFPNIVRQDGFEEMWFEGVIAAGADTKLPVRSHRLFHRWQGMVGSRSFLRCRTGGDSPSWNITESSEQ